jgi:hypothetical protein
MRREVFPSTASSVLSGTDDEKRVFPSGYFAFPPLPWKWHRVIEVAVVHDFQV